MKLRIFKSLYSYNESTPIQSSPIKHLAVWTGRFKKGIGNQPFAGVVKNYVSYLLFSIKHLRGLFFVGRIVIKFNIREHTHMKTSKHYNVRY